MATTTTGESMASGRMEPVMVRMPTDLYEQMRQLADEEDRSIAYILRRAAREYLQRKG